MGYYYNADFTFVIPKVVETAIALDIDTLIAQMNDAQYFKNHLYTRAVFEPQNATGDTVLDRIFDYCGFEINDVSTDEAQETTTYEGYASAKWGTYAEAIILFLASHGVGVDMQCVGEDGERWCYESEVRSGVAMSDSVKSITSRRLEELTRAEEVLGKIRTLVTDPNEYIDSVNYLYERLQALLDEAKPAAANLSKPTV